MTSQAREPPRLGPAAIALGLLIAILLGPLSSVAPEPLAALTVGIAAIVVLAKSPAALVALFAILQPLQDLCFSALPRAARVGDELLLLALVAVVLAGPFVRRPYRVVSAPFFKLAAATVLIGGAGALLNGVSAKVAGAGLFVTLDYVLLFLLLSHLPITEKHARLLVKVIATMAGIAFLAGVAQLIGDRPFFAWQLALRESGIFRVPSLFMHPNDFGYFMLAAAFVCTAAALTTNRASFKALAALCVVGVGLSVSRSSYAALFVGLATGGVLISRRLLKVLVVTGFVVLTILSPVFLGGIEARYAKFTAEGGDARLTYMRQAAPIIAAAPWLGHGPGTFGGSVAERYGSNIHAQYGVRFDDSWMTVDSFWLHSLVESGLLGTGVILLMLLTLILRCRRGLADPDAGPWRRALMIATAMLVAAHLLINVTSMALEANTTAGLLWLIAGVALSGARDPRKAPSG